MCGSSELTLTSISSEFPSRNFLGVSVNILPLIISSVKHLSNSRLLTSYSLFISLKPSNPQIPVFSFLNPHTIPLQSLCFSVDNITTLPSTGLLRLGHPLLPAKS